MAKNITREQWKNLHRSVSHAYVLAAHTDQNTLKLLSATLNYLDAVRINCEDEEGWWVGINRTPIDIDAVLRYISPVTKTLPPKE